MFNFSGLSDCSISHIPPDGSLHVNKGKELIIIKIIIKLLVYELKDVVRITYKKDFTSIQA